MSEKRPEVTSPYKVIGTETMLGCYKGNLFYVNSEVLKTPRYIISVSIVSELFNIIKSSSHLDEVYQRASTWGHTGLWLGRTPHLCPQGHACPTQVVGHHGTASTDNYCKSFYVDKNH